MEKRFQFRDDLTTSNRPFPYTHREKRDNEISLLSKIEWVGDDSPVLAHAKDDLADFLAISFRKEKADDTAAIRITIELTKEGLADVCGYKGRIVDIADTGIRIRAYDDRGAAQAIYDLEETMTTAGQPYLPKGQTRNMPLFSPRMVHSAYGMDTYPAGYLQRLAKEGIDAIMLTVTGVNEVGMGTCDINAVIDLAAEYGIDVYAYWHRPIFHSPEAADAEAVYSAAYGELFKVHNRLKGIILVGEIIQFPSKDPRTTGRPYWEFLNEDRFPDTRPGTSHWPCSDYPVWLDLVKRIIRREKPDADIVFWTYNWGWAPEKDRLALIDQLPTDISLMVTFEMFENLPTDYGITERVCDYSIAFAGPGAYFISEAAAAKRRGIRLYTQANAGGRTWDFGCMPFEPFPQQWMERYKALRECHDQYGLCGIMECHQYGFWPSMITQMERLAYETVSPQPQAILEQVVGRFSNGKTAECLEAFREWSDAIRLYMPTDQEQYGAMRVGPAYPLTLELFPTPPASILPEGSFFGNSITMEYNAPTGLHYTDGKFTLHSIRFRTEIRILREVVRKIRKGLSILRKLRNKSSEIRRLINMGQYMVCCFTTAYHVKEMYLYRQRLTIAPTHKEVRRIIAGIRKLAAAEIQNAERALVCVDKDSAIGFEPLMGYAGDRAHIEWKIRQVNHMLTYELAIYENGLQF